MTKHQEILLGATHQEVLSGALGTKNTGVYILKLLSWATGNRSQFPHIEKIACTHTSLERLPWKRFLLLLLAESGSWVETEDGRPVPQIITK